ncbi:MAG: XTP/dITP diphosphatase [Desulfobacteraceae bacterium]|nr:XTP/dITP diphosphatase [Desulfobacteraceae bacterium]
MTKKIILATRNKGKIKEIRSLFASAGIEIMSLDDIKGCPDIVEDGDTFKDNAFKKARGITEATGLIALADDSGLEVDALNGAPGVYSARFAGEGASDEANNRKLLDMLQGVSDEKRTARFRCVVVLYDPSGRWISADGVCEGVILDILKGENGFGYDPVFFLPWLGRTMAELTKEEKNSISHRAMALKKLKAGLPEFFKSKEGRGGASET